MLPVHRAAGRPLSAVVVVVIISRLCEIQSSARRKKAEKSARTQKNPDIWWREEVLLGVLLIERSVFARAFVPL